ncbi:DUF4340 domain-containing protein [Anaerosacchariphilus polymeriproducens]|uniref:DUF4340 domain-containing protein n=1 Tax=Anaerosacchariphilus polymeriproducens TaxID=1812858 RepID=A0A371AW07_9FIRM|nr:DUF4340 domain-containing protein [Anaerosacchariphilus polymeriproducens]RDU23758.1 DUF4340 domain-containing protein [Anaerosacchariphilus polymeriproducens]
MSKKVKHLIIMGVAFIILLIAYAGVKKINENQTKKKEAKEKAEQITVLKIPTSNITSFSYNYNGSNYVFEKDGDTWFCQQDKNIKLVQADIETMLGTVDDLKAERLIEKSDQNYAAYGLNTPSQTIKIKDKNGNSTVILIGDINNTTSSYYLAIKDQKTVYAVDTATATAFQKTLEDLKQKEQTPDETPDQSTTSK